MCFMISLAVDLPAVVHRLGALPHAGLLDGRAAGHLYRKYNQTDGFFLRDLRGDSDQGKHKQMGPREYLSR